MTISREQFVRGFNALKAHSDARQEIERAAERHGLTDFCLGSSPLERELERQMIDRCRLREDENGPWAEDCDGNTDLELALWDRSFMTITDDAGNPIDFPTTGEALWAMWEKTKTGPFRVRGQVINLNDRKGQQ